MNQKEVAALDSEYAADIWRRRELYGCGGGIAVHDDIVLRVLRCLGLRKTVEALGGNRKDGA